jgi:hypothetical protein
MIKKKRIAISVDFGRKGMACCVADVARYPPTILSLRLSPDVGKINTARTAVDASLALYDSLPAASIHLPEEQPAINRQTQLTEAAYAAAARAHYEEVMHVPIIDVKAEFDLPDGHDAKKRAATRIAAALLGDAEHTLIGDASVTENFCSEKRRHDMADALLIVMWYARKIHGRLTRDPPKRSKKRSK